MPTLRQLFGAPARVVEIASTAGVGTAFIFALLPISLIVALLVNGPPRPVAHGVVEAAFDNRNLAALSNSCAVGLIVAVCVVSIAVFVALVLNKLDLSSDPFIFAWAGISLLVPDYLVGIASYALLEPQFGLTSGVVPDWLLANRASALLCVAAMVTLKWLPVFVAILNVQIALIPSTIIAQSRLDFARYSQQIRYVIAPYFSSLLPVLFTFAFLIAFRQQELATQLTAAGGGYSAEMWANWNYRVIYQFSDLTAAAAESFLTLCVLLAFLEIFRHTAVRNVVEMR
jgi:ABC-type sugar transport system permease subunit